LSREPKGTFNHEAGEIEVRGDLEGREREAVVAHERGHKAFHARVPSWPRVRWELRVFLFSLCLVSLLLSPVGFWSLEFAVVELVPRVVGSLVALMFFDEVVAGLYALRKVPCRWTVRYLVKVGVAEGVALALILGGASP